jgi:apolipoprotein N-acyltransferase
VVGLKASEAPPWRYDKRHLVPFGEFIPPFFKWFTAMMNIPLGDFNRGDLRQPPFDWQGQRVAANICYEDLFGEELGAQFIDPELAPTLFVNISNLAWFGDTLAIDQHLQVARMRALEFERAFVLATNTGATAIVDHRARITFALARNTRGVLVGAVEGRAGVTPYAWWVARFGLWPMWLLAFGLVALALSTSLKKRQAHKVAMHRAGSPEAP